MPQFLHSQRDYLTFIAIAVATFAVLAFALPRWRPGARLPRLAWPVVVGTVAVGWFPVQWAGQAERDKIEALVGGLAPTYAREFERAGHWRITSGTPPDDPVYQSILDLERDWTRLNPAAREIYTLRRREDGRFIFIADADTDDDRNGTISEQERGAAVGAQYVRERDGLDKAFDGHASFSRKIVIGARGASITAWAPIRDPFGKVEAVLGIDFDARPWLEAIAEAREDRMRELALILVIVGVAMLALGGMPVNIARRLPEEAEHRRADEPWHR